jgi:anaerobic selenocysteine-containing dehydrogenase
MPDVLLDIGRRLTPSLADDLPWENYQQLLQSAFRSLPASEEAPDPWTLVEQQGGWWAEAPQRQPSAAAGRQTAIALTEPRFGGEGGQFPFHLLPFPSQAFRDGSTAHLPWLQELPDAVSTVMWGSWIEINPRTAAGLGIAQGDLVEIVSTEGRIETRALLSPGIAPDVVAVPVGQGHQSFTRYASERGANPLAILSPLEEPETGTIAWAATRVRIAKVNNDENAARLITFAGGLREHAEHHR